MPFAASPLPSSASASLGLHCTIPQVRSRLQSLLHSFLHELYRLPFCLHFALNHAHSCMSSRIAQRLLPALVNCSSYCCCLPAAVTPPCFEVDSMFNSTPMRLEGMRTPRGNEVAAMRPTENKVSDRRLQLNSKEQQQGIAANIKPLPAPHLQAILHPGQLRSQLQSHVT